MKTLIKNIDIVTSEKVIENGFCVIDGGSIGRFGQSMPEMGEEYAIIDGEGGYLLPGFVDIHCHGADNLDFMDADAEGFNRIAEYHLKNGTTTMLATTLADSPDATEKSIRTFGEYKEKYPSGSLAGLHLEGPWFSFAQGGAQKAEYFKNPVADELRQLKKRYPYILRVSAAPELDGGMEFGRAGRECGIVMSAAHTDADFSEIEEASKNGYTLMTHFYSCMKGVTRKNAYRVAGAVEAGLYFDDIYVEIIADGKHLPPELLRLIYKFKGADRICLVTDASRACGLPEGTVSTIGSLDHGTKIIVEDGVAKLLDRTAFGGSVATTELLFKTMADAIGRELPALVKMASLIPSRIMGFKDRGDIFEGARADILITDRQFNIRKVIFNGKEI